MLIMVQPLEGYITYSAMTQRSWRQMHTASRAEAHLEHAQTTPNSCLKLLVVYSCAAWILFSVASHKYNDT